MKTKIESIDPDKKIIKCEKEDEKFEEKYDKLILATGAKATFPPIKKLYQDDKKERFVEGVHVVRTLDDAKKISSQVKPNGKATVIGAGLIGMEMADCLYKKNMKVTLVEALPYILPNNFDKDMAKIVNKKIPDQISIFTNHLATKIKTEDQKIKKVVIKNKENNDEKEIDTDLLVIATGTKPETTLAEKAGCKTGETGGIIVNKKMETTVENIYAVGDCTEYPHFITGKPVHIGLGSIAVKQGIAAGVNSAGGKYYFPEGVIQTSTSHFFDTEIAAVGTTEEKMENISTISGKYKGLSLPEYFPGGKPITLKVMVDEKTENIVAAQAVGENAAQRINTLACAVYNKMDVNEFRKMETAYAPPVAPTLDAVTLVCDVAALKLNRKKQR